MPSLEIIAQDNNRCGEGPIWDAAQDRLIWNDLNSSLVFQYVPATSAKSVISRNLNAAGIALNYDGNLVFAGMTGLHLWLAQDNYQTIAAEHDGETLIFNDILADPQGRLYAGTYYWNEKEMERPGKLYRIDSDGSIYVMDEGIELSNGLGLSPDNRTLYYADSTARRIYAYDVSPKTGDLSHRRVFIQVPLSEGLPDGLTVDAEGYVWSAQWYGSQVVRYDPEGRVERRIELPVAQVTSVAFGGPDLADLYITSAAESWPAWPNPYAPSGYHPDKVELGGSLYRLSLDIQGKAEHYAKFESE
ncbi:MAG: SMP-30/gluconolactonase/LRE family protein [Anaerolineales bacterium]|nr:SMP-30/gluconolactonase/LRE family protein [Anaerolineales bacterium]